MKEIRRQGAEGRYRGAGRGRRQLAGMCLAAVLAAFGVTAAAAEPAQKVTLENGLRVILKPNLASQVVALELLVKASAADESPQAAGVRQLAQQLLLRGTRRRSGAEVGRALELLGASLQVSVGLDYTEVYGLSSAAHFEEMLRLLAEVVTQPSFAAEELEKQRQLALEFLRSQRDDAFQATYLAFREMLYDDSAYGRAAAGTEAGLKALTREQVVNLYESYYGPNNAVLAVSGNVDAPRAMKVIAQAFSGWRRAALPTEARSPGSPAALTESVVEVREGPVESAALILGFAAPAAGEQDFFALQVMESLLGGGMSSRLSRRLREEWGLAYEVTCFYPTLRGESHFAAYLLTDPARMAEAKDLVVAELERLRREPVPAAELRRAKAFLLGSYALAHQRTKQQAYYLAWYELLGLGAEFDEEYPKGIEAVTAEQVQQAAQRHFQRYALALLLPDH